ncbi:MAG: hypothetical protein JWQ66_2591 [Mucilaginibacter sp.]|jgi:hypothetical protein|nr:hypothetical protein [Mucilaginibacter sp.]
MAQKINKGFQVKLDGIELSEAALTRIEFGIQEVILRELAAYHPVGESGSGDGFAFVLPHLWRGFILRRLSQGDVKTFGAGGGGFNEMLKEG